MPRPPTLPLIDWKRIFDGAKEWQPWLESAESADQATRMRERADTLTVPDACQKQLESLSRDVHVIAIAEDWCGDVIRHAPVMAVIEKANPRVKVRFISRADNPDLFARFLTNGGEAIPKFIFLNSDFVECGNWGPMQADCRLLVARGKAIGDVSAGRARVREIYAADAACRTAFAELCALVELAGATGIE